MGRSSGGYESFSHARERNLIEAPGDFHMALLTPHPNGETHEEPQMAPMMLAKTREKSLATGWGILMALIVAAIFVVAVAVLIFSTIP